MITTISVIWNASYAVKSFLSVRPVLLIKLVSPAAKAISWTWINVQHAALSVQPVLNALMEEFAQNVRTETTSMAKFAVLASNLALLAQLRLFAANALQDTQSMSTNAWPVRASLYTVNYAPPRQSAILAPLMLSSIPGLMPVWHAWSFSATAWSAIWLPAPNARTITKLFREYVRPKRDQVLDW